MANVPYDPMRDQIDPTSRPPDMFTRVDASPDAFGAATGRAMQSFGREMQQTAAVALKVQDQYDDVAAENALNQYQERIRLSLRGDPNVMVPGPDGVPRPQTGFMALQGENAMNARQGVQKELSEFEKQLGNTLKSPIAKRKFSAAARSYRTNAFNQIDAHTDSQANEWYKQVYSATAKNALIEIASNPDDPEKISEFLGDLRVARLQELKLAGLGNSPEAIKNVEAGVYRDALKVQTEAIAINDPSRALRMVEKGKATLGPLYDELYNKFRARADQQDGMAAGLEAFTRAQSGAVVAPQAAAPGQAQAAPTEGDQASLISSAIIQQESGGNRDVGTSKNGAVGIGQIMPDTFKRYALPGERIDNPDDNLRVSKRITDEYYNKYNGDAARVAVAYFSGEGNVAPEGSETPWIKDYKDANGKSVSSYVADISGRLGGEVGMRPAGVYGTRYDAFQSILKSDLSPGAKSVALATLRTNYEILNARDSEMRRQQAAAQSEFTSTFEIELKRGKKTYADIENAWREGKLSDTKRTDLTLWLDNEGQKQAKITNDVARVAAAFEGGPRLDPASTDDKKAVDFHYNLVSQTWKKKNLSPQEQINEAINYAGQVGMAPTPLKTMIRGNLRSGNSGEAVLAANTLKELNNQNPQILKDFNEEDISLGTMIWTLTDYGVPPEKAYTDSIEAMKVPKAERDTRARIFDTERGSDFKQREAKDKEWLRDKLNSVWSVDPTLDSVMYAEWENLTRQEFVKTGNLDAARSAAYINVNKNWARSEVGGAYRYMKYAPEKFYGVPTMSPAENATWMNEQLLQDISTGAFVDPSNPLTADRLRIAVDPTRTKQDGSPVYLVSVLGADGAYYEVRDTNNRPMSWVPDWDRSTTKKLSKENYDKQIDLMRQMRQDQLTESNTSGIEMIQRRRDQFSRMAEGPNAVSR